MDLLAVFSSLRKHKIIVLVVLLLTLGGDVFVYFGLPPQYESSAQYILTPPPAGPTEEEIKKDPSLAHLNDNNPYLRVMTLSVVVDVLASRVGADDVRDELIAQGADKDYVVAGTNATGTGQVVQITGTGHSGAQADKTRDLVVARMIVELHAMQTVNGADDRYLIKALLVTQTTEPVRKITVTVRSLIAVTAAGLIFLFALISVADAIAPMRARRRGQAAVPPSAPAAIMPGVASVGVPVTGSERPEPIVPRVVWRNGSTTPSSDDETTMISAVGWRNDGAPRQDRPDHHYEPEANPLVVPYPGVRNGHPNGTVQEDDSTIILPLFKGSEN